MAERKTAGKVRARLVAQVDAAWEAFTDSYAGLSPRDLVEPGVTKAWSVRDIIVHITVWEEEALKHLPGVLEGRRPPRYSVTYGGINAFNALMTKQRQGLSLDEVFEQQAAVHQRLIRFIARTDEDLLASGSRFRHRLKLDTYGHYPGHTGAIIRWRSQR